MTDNPLIVILSVAGSVASLYSAWILIADRLGYYSWWGIQRRARKVVRLIQEAGFDPDIVVGIGRSGAIFGGMLAGDLGIKPLAVVDRRYEWDAKGDRHVRPILFVPADAIKGQKVLLVEGAPRTGLTLRVVRNAIEKLLPDEIRSAAPMRTRHTITKIQFYAETVKTIRRMPWRITADYRED